MVSSDSEGLIDLEARESAEVRQLANLLSTPATNVGSEKILHRRGLSSEALTRMLSGESKNWRLTSKSPCVFLKPLLQSTRTTMASHTLAIAKASLAACLTKPDPASLTKTEIASLHATLLLLSRWRRRLPCLKTVEASDTSNIYK